MKRAVSVFLTSALLLLLSLGSSAATYALPDLLTEQMMLEPSISSRVMRELRETIRAETRMKRNFSPLFFDDSQKQAKGFSLLG